MTTLQLHANYRSPRLQLADITPAVLRLPDGRSSRGKLETISLTGGLLSLSPMLDRGSRIRLMFLTRMGPVLGAAEMLSPISATRQPFRFVAIEKDDQHRLRATVRSSLDQKIGDQKPEGHNPLDQNRCQNPGQNAVEQAWIQKYRAAHADRNQPRRGVFRAALTVLTLLTLCLGTAAYLLGVHLPR